MRLVLVVFGDVGRLGGWSFGGEPVADLRLQPADRVRLRFAERAPFGFRQDECHGAGLEIGSEHGRILRMQAGKRRASISHRVHAFCAWLHSSRNGARRRKSALAARFCQRLGAHFPEFRPHSCHLNRYWLCGRATSCASQCSSASAPWSWPCALARPCTASRTTPRRHVAACRCLAGPNGKPLSATTPRARCATCRPSRRRGVWILTSASHEAPAASYVDADALTRSCSDRPAPRA